MKAAFESMSTMLANMVIIALAGVAVWSFYIKPNFFPTTSDGRPLVESINTYFDITPEMPLYGDNKVTLVEFMDFECPACRAYSQAAASEIEQLPISYLSVNFPLESIHPNANKAARAAICGDGNASNYAIHKSLLNKPLADLAETECMKSDITARTLMIHKTLGKVLKVSGTPTFFLGIKEGDRVTLKRRFNGGGPNPALLKEEIAKIAQY